MDGLEPYCNLQSPRKLACKGGRSRADGARVRLDRHPGEWFGEPRNARQVGDGNSARVEEIARIVELQAVRRRCFAVVEHILNLLGQRARRRRAIDRPLPQVAKRTGKWALGAGEKDRQRALDAPV